MQLSKYFIQSVTKDAVGLIPSKLKHRRLRRLKADVTWWHRTEYTGADYQRSRQTFGVKMLGIALLLKPVRMTFPLRASINTVSFLKGNNSFTA